MALKNKYNTNTILLSATLTVAAILRFWNYSEMPYMHDELSALARTDFNHRKFPDFQVGVCA
jgi:uncharacterized membrane protein